MMDPKLAELGLIDDPDEAALAAYEQYVRNGGLQQLRRMKHGDQLLLVDTASSNGTFELGERARVVVMEKDTELRLGKKTFLRWRWA